jgi:hypothetical protein
MPLTVLASREPITVEVVHDTESPQFLAPRIPSECPVCGAYSLAPEANVSVLLAVCDVLVLKALEKMGNFIVRAERQRYQVIGDKPKYMAHTIWTPTEDVVAKAIRGAWDVVPILLQTHSGCCSFDAGLVVELLDLYVRDLAITGSEHDIDELAYRLRTKLSLPVYRTVVE